MKRLRERLIFGLQVPKVSPKWQSMTGLITIRGKNHWDISFMWMRPICPGRLVKIPLDGNICAHTGILVNFWVNDMTTWKDTQAEGKPLPPNVNMNFTD